MAVWLGLAFVMGRRATRRRHKKKYNSQKSCYSDPESIHGSQINEKEMIRRERCESLDDLALIDYATNAASNDPSTVRDEMDVTRRLSSLNVCDLMTSDVETIYSEFPPSATLVDNLPGEFVPLERLKERQYRKRSSKRNRKRTKKAKALLPGSEESMSIPVGKHRRPSHASRQRFNPIAWVRSTGEPVHKCSPGNEHLETARYYSDASSRALTDSDESPILDDIIMVDSGQDDEETGRS